MNFDVGDTVRCTNHPFLKDIVGTVLYTNGYFVKIKYTSNTIPLERFIVLAVARLIKHTPQEFVSPLLQKIKELEFRFKNKNSPNPYAPPSVYGNPYEDEEEEDPYYDPDDQPAEQFPTPPTFVPVTW